ncbi:hypothetical protein D3C80_1812060 [compost metagenome]
MHEPLNVLDHDDRIIDQQADGEHHGVHGEYVDTEAEIGQKCECGEQHHGNGQSGNQCGPEAL